MYDPDSEYFYKRLFLDIGKGFTPLSYLNEDVFIKHLSINDYTLAAEQQSVILNKALKRGIPKKENIIADAIRDGYWTQEDENFIESQTMFVDNLNKSKEHLLLKSEKDLHQKTIDEETKKLNEKIIQKNNLTKDSAEEYAVRQINDYYVVRSLFKNKDLTEPYFTFESFSELSYSEVSEIIKINNSHANNFSELNIQKMILEEFFFPYMFLCEKPTELFGVPAINLSSYQITVLLFARIFKNIFENVKDIPEKIKKDPEALIEFSNSSESREKTKELLEKDGASTVFGATEKDYSDLGVSSTDISKSKSLHQAAKEKGGSLSMQDLMDMH
tara:strand:+ start:83 stop:1075 length:993 start_codon:yes stop_codon:yes gene_type:complete